MGVEEVGVGRVSRNWEVNLIAGEQAQRGLGQRCVEEAQHSICGHLEAPGKRLPAGIGARLMPRDTKEDAEEQDKEEQDAERDGQLNYDGED
ncbi:hypothetical protein ABBQ32_013291 [Trebouxia sp. C0010 RCD-2024]